MTFLASRKTSRTIAATAVLAAASSLAACGNSSKTAAEVPVSSASSSSQTSSATSTPSSSSATSKASATPSSTTKRVSRSEARVAPVTTTTTKTVVVPASTTYVKSDALAKGKTKVTTEGSNGQAVTTYSVTKLGNKVISTKETGTKVTKGAVNRVITVGTHVDAPKPAATATSAPAKKTEAAKQVSRSTVRKSLTTHQSAPKKSTPKATAKPAAKSTKAAAATGNAGMWNSIASCESGNNWSINTGNGFYGGLQFTQQTWAGFGGTAYAPRADLASQAQQMAIADKVLAVQGRGAWPVCGR